MKIAASILFAVVVYATALLLLAGCQPAITPAAAADVQSLRDKLAIQQQQSTVDLVKVKEDLATKATLGQLSPATHPFDAVNETIKELHPWLLTSTIVLAAAALAAWIASFFFTTLPFLSKLALALSKAAILSLSVLIGLPFGVWCGVFILAAFFIVYLIEAIRDHFDLRKAMVDTLAIVGVKLGATPEVAVAEAKAAIPPVVSKVPSLMPMPVTINGGPTNTTANATAKTMFIDSPEFAGTISGK